MHAQNSGSSMQDRMEKRNEIRAANEERLQNAQETRVQIQEQRQENMEERQENREERQQERQENRCEVVGNIVDRRISNYTQNKDYRIERYNELLAKLSDVVDRLAASDLDLDTSALEDSLATLDEMVQAYAASYEDFIAGLEDSKGLVCGESEGAYKDIVLASKDKLEDLRAQRKAITEFYRNEVRGAIKDLREQAREQLAADTSSEDLEEGNN